MLDQELDIMEQYPQTEAELIDQQTEIEDYAGDMDEILGEDALETDMEHAYDSFFTRGENDYNGFDRFHVRDEEEEQELADAFYGGGYHIEVAPGADVE